MVPASAATIFDELFVIFCFHHVWLFLRYFHNCMMRFLGNVYLCLSVFWHFLNLHTCCRHFLIVALLCRICVCFSVYVILLCLFVFVVLFVLTCLVVICLCCLLFVLCMFVCLCLRKQHMKEQKQQQTNANNNQQITLKT